MNKRFTLSIKNPCSENWQAFSPISTGRFCNNCQKNVVDFTKMDEKEVISFFKTRNTNVCGRFYQEQLKSYPKKTDSKPSNRYQLLKASVFSILLIGGAKKSIAQHPIYLPSTEKRITLKQNKIKQDTLLKSEMSVEGIVIDATDGLPLPGVTVYIKGTQIGVNTNFDGEFKFPQKLKKGDVLVFSYIGYESKEYVLSAKNLSKLKINMKLELSLSCQMMGELTVDGLYKEESQSGFSKFFKNITNIFK